MLTTKGTTDMEKYRGKVLRKVVMKVRQTFARAELVHGCRTKEGICRTAMPCPSICVIERARGLAQDSPTSLSPCYTLQWGSAPLL